MKNPNPVSPKRISDKITPLNCTAFEGHRRIASGRLAEVARRIKIAADRGNGEPILVFDDLTSELVEIDLRGTVDQIVNRLTPPDTTAASVVEGPPKRGPGRPKLGVIPREVTLLPGQWDWLDEQPGGASAALRRLVYEARRTSQGKDQARHAQEAVYRFMTTMAGDLPGFEEALRSFYRRDHQRFDSLVSAWPKDILAHVKKLVAVVRRELAATPVSKLC
jgi:hypothetical protein